MKAPSGPGRMLLVLAAVLAGAACSTAPLAPPAERAPAADWPAFPPPADSETVYRIDESRSVLLARVDPEGPMARLGHSHVVGGAVLSGRLVTGGAGPRADVRVRAADFEVDRPEWRRAHGLESDLDDSAIEGTRRNLLGPGVLDAGAHPLIEARSVEIRGPEWLPVARIAVRWRGSVRAFDVPVAVQRDDATLVASARIELRHTDFGIEPFSAAGGALRVSDRIEVRLRIVAERDVAIIAR